MSRVIATAVMLGLILIAGPATSSPAATKGDEVYTRCRPADLPTDTADCRAAARTSAAERKIDFVSSVVTPGGGTLPGWGTAGTSSILALRREISEPKKVAAFAVKLRVGSRRETQPLIAGAGWARSFLRVHARHLKCSACRVYGARVATKSQTVVLTFRDRETKDAEMPPGPVEIIVEVHSEAAMRPPFIGPISLYIGAAPIVFWPPLPGEASTSGTVTVLSAEAV